MSIDWDIWIGRVSDIVVAVAAIGAFIIAYMGLHTWRDELRVRNDYEVARGVLVAAIRLRNELAYFRRSITSRSSKETRELRNLGIDPTSLESGNAGDRRQAAHALNQIRWEPIASAVSTLEAAAIEAEAVLDSAISDHIKKLMTLTGKLQRGAFKRVEQMSTSFDEHSPEARQELDRLLYDDPGDAFANEMEESVEALKEVLQKYVFPSKR